jgi:biotin carboxyl carrier protein
VVALIETKVGDRIAAGDPVMFVESMKMQIPVLVEETGTVQRVLVARGDAVAEGQVVAILET